MNSATMTPNMSPATAPITVLVLVESWTTPSGGSGVDNTWINGSTIEIEVSSKTEKSPVE